jgi:hypothetical protein
MRSIRKVLTWGSLGLAAGLALIALVVPRELSAAGYTITETILQGRQWVYSTVQTFSAGISAPSNRIPGSTSYTNSGAAQLLQFQADFTIADTIGAPTGGTTGGFGSCTNATSESYRIAVSFLNPSGETAIGGVLPFTTSGTGKQIQNINRPTAPALATHWRFWYAKNSETFGVWRACNTTSAGSGGTSTKPYFAVGSTVGACACAVGAVGPPANTTGPFTFADVRDGEMRFFPGSTTVAEGTTSPVLTSSVGLDRLYVRGPTAQVSFDGGATTQTLLTNTAATLTTGTRLYLDGGANTYLVWDAATQQVQVVTGNVVRGRITSTGVAPGDCDLDVYGLGKGEQCYEPTSGITWIRDERGVHQVGS